jgi:hypothetical protein
MPGIDDRVEQTANAYMGNPKALQQKYAQTKDIFDLIALNTINEKVSAASREMRLRAGAEGKPPTLYERAESQAVDNTKKEMIDEQAGVMQNKLREQQEAQKKLMQAAGAPQPQGGGIMSAMPQRPPSAGISGVAAPNMQGMASMAGGGIVAFDEGGNVDPLAAATGMSPEDLARDRERAERIRAREEAEKDALLQNFLRQAGAPQARRTSAEVDAQYVAQDTQEGRGAPPPAVAATPRGDMPSGGAPSGGAPGTVGFGIRSLIGSKTPEQAASEMEARAAAAANFNPEERAAKERQIRERTAFDKDSELTNFLLGMAGRSSIGSAIAGGGAALQNTRNQALAARQRAEGELIDIGPASRTAGFKAGEARFRDVVLGMAQGVDAAVKQAQVASSAADRALAREGMDYNRAATTMATLTGRITAAKKDINDAYIKSINGLFIPAGQKPNNAQQQAIDIIETTKRLGLAELEALVGPQLLAAETKMGIPSTGGFSLIGVRPNTPPK